MTRGLRVISVNGVSIDDNTERQASTLINEGLFGSPRQRARRYNFVFEELVQVRSARWR